MKYEIPEVKLARLRECQIDNPSVETPERATAFWRENVVNATWFDPDTETVVVLLLNTRKKIIGFARVSSGTLDTCLVHPREIFKTAIVQGAAGIVIMHNHPSGDPTPSEADIKFTRDIVRAGQLLKIEAVDSVVVGDPGSNGGKGFCSLRESGYFY